MTNQVLSNLDNQPYTNKVGLWFDRQYANKRGRLASRNFGLLARYVLSFVLILLVVMAGGGKLKLETDITQCAQAAFCNKFSPSQSLEIISRVTLVEKWLPVSQKTAEVLPFPQRWDDTPAEFTLLPLENEWKGISLRFR